MPQEFYFDWYWDLESSPQAIWTLASDTNRFNRDTGQPDVEMLGNIKGVKRVRMKLPVIKVEWEEEPFEWTYPYSFGILLIYRKGPIDEMRVQANIHRRPNGGTRELTRCDGERDFHRQAPVPAFHERRFFEIVNHKDERYQPEKALKWDGIQEGH